MNVYMMRIDGKGGAPQPRRGAVTDEDMRGGKDAGSRLVSAAADSSSSMSRETNSIYATTV